MNFSHKKINSNGASQQPPNQGTFAGQQIKIPHLGIFHIRSYLRRSGVYRRVNNIC
jgi:hypothetical protein